MWAVNIYSNIKLICNIHFSNRSLFGWCLKQNYWKNIETMKQTTLLLFFFHFKFIICFVQIHSYSQSIDHMLWILPLNVHNFFRFRLWYWRDNFHSLLLLSINYTHIYKYSRCVCVVVLLSWTQQPKRTSDKLNHCLQLNIYKIHWVGLIQFSIFEKKKYQNVY